MECKLLSRYSTPYFCSKFLLYVIDWLYVVPDPVKVVAKLGRHDMSNWEHVEEYRVSCLDAWSVYDNELIVDELSRGVFERYGGVYDCSKLLRVLTTVVRDPVLFRSLFIEEDGANLCLDPSRARLD